MMTTLAVEAEAAAAVPVGPHWVVFMCDGLRLAVALDRVREILTPRPVTRLPGCGPEVRGLVGVRGRLITVLDLGAALGRRPSGTVDDHRMLVVERGEHEAAFAVDAVITIAPSFTRPPDADGVPLHEAELIGTGDVEGELFHALEPDRLLDRLLL